MFRLNTNILYWPFALEGDMLNGADAWLRGNLAQHWPDHQLTTWTDLDGHAPDELLDFDLLFVGGGNTSTFWHTLPRMPSLNRYGAS